MSWNRRDIGAQDEKLSAESRAKGRLTGQVSLVLTSAAALVVYACGSSGGGAVGAGYSDDAGTSSGGSGSSSGTSGGSSGASSGSSGGKSSSGGTTPPPVACSGKTDGPVTTLDFSNNLIASPAPPGNLAAQNAPQIVVFGWDDIESAAATAYLNTLLTSVKNPDSSPASCTVNPNSCYGEGWNQTTTYACGDGSLGTDRASVLAGGCELGNHSFDHLENYEEDDASGTWTGPNSWPGIPTQYKDTTNGGWIFSAATGFGPGVSMDQATWQSVITANDTELKNIYATPTTVINGFRAPRLEINDNGLNAIKAVGYEYDQDLEETLPDGAVAAAVAADTVGAKVGFNWFAWPYTLDNGSPGVWNQQSGGDASYIQNFPTGLWEVPVYEIYVPTSDGTAVANQMIFADTDCILPTTNAPPGPGQDCYLSPGEVPAGSAITEVTGFDFNAFIYSRMTPAQWTDTMEHTFLLHYYGDRAPMTYGAHPVEYTAPYDSYTLETQANNYGYRDVIKYSTYDTRQAALTAFIQWIVNDPVLSKDTYFMSAGQLVDYMKAPTDKTGKPVPVDTVASPDSNGLFTLDWAGTGATISVVSGNAANIVFNVTSGDADPVSVEASVPAGSLKGVSHIDIKYTSEIPFRVRLLTANGAVSTTVLLAGVGGDRLARIRMKDFFPGPEASQSDVTSFTTPVDATYLANVTGIQFESAATPVQAPAAKAFNTNIEQITLHGVATSALCGN